MESQAHGADNPNPGLSPADTEGIVPTASCLWMAAVLVGSNPAALVVTDQVDLIEVNHYFDEHGRHVFDQTIYYEWCPVQGRYQVRAWRLVKSPSQVPSRDPVTGQYSALWHDGGVLRRVFAKSVRETWTQYDPELSEQEFLPKDQRRDLCKPLAVLAPQLPDNDTQLARLTPAASPRAARSATESTQR
ncbi:MAG: hypothetical protein KatS3mg110_0864 [Pirellulaceae bacterium]|nr:MAG: hypothetical protein KatS3mg110_0864 [Pirellulaceae bacterium]